jgi:hypothetical protein
MRTEKLLFSRIGLFLFALYCCVTTNAQPQQTADAPSLNYGFVSPNTHDDLKLQDAIRGMTSNEETDLLRRARNLGCVVKRRITTSRALGSWSDGAEHSVLLRIKTDEPTIRYLMSRLGRDANQKAVLYFHPQRTGRAFIYTFRAVSRARSIASLGRTLDAAGISFRTLVPSRQGTTIYVIDTDGTLAAKVKTAASRLRTRLSFQNGTASFIGDNSLREKGQTVFAREINEYESKHPALPPPCEGK